MSKKRNNKKYTANKKTNRDERKNNKFVRIWNEINRKKGVKILVSLIVAAFVFIKFLYPYYMDYKDGKWGGALVLHIPKGHEELNAPSGNELIYLYYSVPESSEGKRFLIPIDLAVKNSYENTEKDVRLSLRFDKKNLRRLLPEEAMKSSGTVFEEDSPHKIITNSDYDYSVYGFKYLQGGAERSISDAAFSSNLNSSPTSRPLFTSSQGVDIQVVTQSERTPEKAWNLKYRGVQMSGENELTWWMQNFIGKSTALDVRKNESFFSFFIGIVLNKEVFVYTFEPEFRYVDSIKTYIPKSGIEEYKVFKFSPYVWNLLF